MLAFRVRILYVSIKYGDQYEIEYNQQTRLSGKERFGNDTIIQEFGVSPESLTHQEAAYINRFKTVESLRNRAAAERRRSGIERDKEAPRETTYSRKTGASVTKPFPCSLPDR